MKIGDTVYVYEGNRRYYAEPLEKQRSGYKGSRVIERGHWRPVQVLDETSRSWIVGLGGYDQRKISKKDLREGRVRGFAVTIEDVDRRVFLSPPTPHLIEKAIHKRVCESTTEELLELIRIFNVEGLPEIGEDCNINELRRLADNTPWEAWAKAKLKDLEKK